MTRPKMLKIKPPGPGYRINGGAVPEEGIELPEREASALIKEGWQRVGKTEPETKKRKEES